MTTLFPNLLFRYESDAERNQSIARMAELRDAVDAYRASCATRYREENRDGSHSDRWLASRGVTPVPLEAPQRMFNATDKQCKFGQTANSENRYTRLIPFQRRVLDPS